MPTGGARTVLSGLIDPPEVDDDGEEDEESDEESDEDDEDDKYNGPLIWRGPGGGGAGGAGSTGIRA